VIGGADKYMAVCRKCHLKPAMSKSLLKQVDNQITSAEVGHGKSHNESSF
jgi:hypothetical protein